MRRALAAAALPILASCASLAPGDLPSARPGLLAPRPLEELAAYVARLNAMSEAGLAAEARRARPTGARAGDDLARTKAAAALLLAPGADEADATALLEPVTRREGGDPGLKAMASFLHALATDRRRQRESAAAAGARLREERRTALERAAQLQERATQLQQKLDALTELEKSLSDRPLSSR